MQGEPGCNPQQWSVGTHARLCFRNGALNKQCGTSGGCRGTAACSVSRPPTLTLHRGTARPLFLYFSSSRTPLPLPRTLSAKNTDAPRWKGGSPTACGGTGWVAGTEERGGSRRRGSTAATVRSISVVSVASVASVASAKEGEVRAIKETSSVSLGGEATCVACVVPCPQRARCSHWGPWRTPPQPSPHLGRVYGPHVGRVVQQRDAEVDGDVVGGGDLVGAGALGEQVARPHPRVLPVAVCTGGWRGGGPATAGSTSWRSALKRPGLRNAIGSYSYTRVRGWAARRAVVSEGRHRTIPHVTTHRHSPAFPYAIGIAGLHDPRLRFPIVIPAAAPPLTCRPT